MDFVDAATFHNIVVNENVFAKEFDLIYKERIAQLVIAKEIRRERIGSIGN